MMSQQALYWEEFQRFVQKGYADWQILEGETITHRIFGSGRIISVDSDRSLIVQYSVERIEYQISQLRTVFQQLRLSQRLLELNPKILETLRARTYVRESKSKSLANLNSSPRSVPLIELSRLALKNTINTIVKHPTLEQQDIELTLQWDNRFSRTLDVTRIIRELSKGRLSKDYTLGRLLSARAAELAAMEFFRRNGFHVNDISIHQITNCEKRDWLTHDMTIDGSPVDVKNSRRTERNKNTYVEHCVPTFKQDRQGKDIALVGVLSNYLWPSYLLNPDKAQYDTSILILGLTDWPRLTALKEFFDTSLLEIDLPKSFKSGSFLPAWVFEYSPRFYEKRDDTLVTVRDAPLSSLKGVTYAKRRGESYWSIGNVLPILIASGRNVEEYQNLGNLHAWEVNFITRIHAWRTKVGLSLPFLFCSILSHFLDMLTLDFIPSHYSPKKYRHLLFFDDASANMPLFIYDPLKTIDSLITALTTIWNTNRNVVQGFRAFKLQGLNILQGKRSGADTRWTTLVAYCGGRREDGRKCALNPLVLGDIEHGQKVTYCPRCGRLICPICGYCSGACQQE